MNKAIIVTGTDTGIGKTIFSAALCSALGAQYWKPVQAGMEPETDTQIVTKLAGCEAFKETYRLEIPASPHISAEQEGITIDTQSLEIPETSKPLVIEGAGGLMVPLNRQELYIDIFAIWKAPIVLCARTSLGTINHSLLSVSALRNAGCNILGIAFIGDEVADSERTICKMGNVKRLGRLPFLSNLNSENLNQAFQENFNTSDFLTE